jgi:hypothetical protein
VSGTDSSLHRALRPDFVPREHLGRARELRNRVLAEDARVVPVLLGVAEPLLRRLVRHPALRREHVAGAVRDWQVRMPGRYRIGAVSVSRGKVFAISEKRLSAHTLRVRGWDGEEPGVSIIQFGLCVLDGALKPIRATMALASLHSIARRIERGHERSEDAVLRDLARLADPTDAEGSGWLGRMSAIPSGEEVFNARSWWPPG